MTGPRPAIKIKAEKKVLLYQTQLDELDPRLRENDELFAFICHSRSGEYRVFIKCINIS